MYGQEEDEEKKETRLQLQSKSFASGAVFNLYTTQVI